MSFWQAWGRTGLEAMAAGCVPVLPAGSGASEYATHNVNAKLVDTSDSPGAAREIERLVRNGKRRAALRAAGLQTAGGFDVAASVACARFLLSPARRGASAPLEDGARACATLRASFRRRGSTQVATASLSLLRLLCDGMEGRFPRAALAPSPCATDARLDFSSPTTNSSVAELPAPAKPKSVLKPRSPPARGFLGLW